MSSSHLARAVRRIESLADQQLPTQCLIEGVAEELHTAMPVDALVLAATDPDTLLGLGAGVVHGMPASVCAPFWEYEFEVPDFNKFTDLARSARNVADLHAATGGRPQRSARWREFRTFMDADAELRATFNAGGRGWGLLHLNRAGTAHGFRDDEVAFVETIAPIVGRALRLSLISHPGPQRRGLRAGDGDRRCRQPPRVRHPRGAGLVRQARVDLSPARSGARARRAERGHDRRAGGAGRARTGRGPRACARATASGC